jgi:hypothetical protein
MKYILSFSYLDINMRTILSVSFTLCITSGYKLFNPRWVQRGDSRFIFGSPFKADTSLGFKLYKNIDYNLNRYIGLRVGLYQTIKVVSLRYDHGAPQSLLLCRHYRYSLGAIPQYNKDT